MTNVQDRPVVDDVDTSSIPFRATDPAFVPAERYYDETFFRLEKEKLWMRVWQPACRLDEIPEPGDFTEYRILDQSVLLIRQPDESVRAFHNACRHRGTALGCGSGSFRSSQIVCPFHGWRWSLDGTNTYVYAQPGFRSDTMQQGDLNLSEVAVGIKWGLVWVNFAADPTPFEDNFRGVEEAMNPHGIERMHVTWWHQIEFEANWKVTQEAFFEAYHVMQTHPEMALFLRDDEYNALLNARYGIDPQGHGWMHPDAPLRFEEASQSEIFNRASLKSPAELWHATIETMWQGAQAQTTARQVAISQEVLDNYPHDQYFDKFYARVYEEAAANNVPLPPLDPKMTGHFTVFPNFTGVLSLGTALVYRSRPHPTDPNKCIYDFWALEIPPEGTPITPPIEGKGPSWDDLWFVQQDASNIQRMQIGLRTKGHKANRMGLDLERMIINWHEALDRFMAR